MKKELEGLPEEFILFVEGNIPVYTRHFEVIKVNDYSSKDTQLIKVYAKDFVDVYVFSLYKIKEIDEYKYRKTVMSIDDIKTIEEFI